MTMEELFCMLRDMEMDDRFYCRPVVRRVAMHPDTLREVSFSPVVNLGVLGVLDFVNDDKQETATQRPSSATRLRG